MSIFKEGSFVIRFGVCQDDLHISKPQCCGLIRVPIVEQNLIDSNWLLVLQGDPGRILLVGVAHCGQVPIHAVGGGIAATNAANVGGGHQGALGLQLDQI